MILLSATLLAIAVAVVSGIIMVWLGHGLDVISAWSALFLGFLAGAIAWRSVPKGKIIFQKKTFWEWLVIAVFVMGSLRAFLWLVYYDGDGIKVLSPNNLGDLSLHLGFIRYLGKVTHWLPSSPLLIHEPLRYPIGADFFNSLLLLVGVPIEQGLIWTGLVGAALTGVALWHWGRAFGLAALLFNGGLAGVVLWHGLDPESQVQWKNLFLSMFVTQRGFLYALPAGLSLLANWRDEFFSITEESSANPLPVWIQIILLGTLPLFSPHSFLFLAAIMSGIFFLDICARKKLITLALVSWPLALLSMFVISPGGTGRNFMGWHPGWMQEGNVIWFWLWNFGIALPLVIILAVMLFFKNDPQSKMARAFVWPSVMVFIACMLIRFAPWPWDSMKLMLWSWLTLMPFVWTIIIKPRESWLRALLCMLLFGSGAVTLVDGLGAKHGYKIARGSEVDAAAALLKNIPADAAIATAPEYNHPVLLLGQPVVAGYEGHLWSHGLDYHERFSKLHSIMMGEDGWELTARRLGVRFIYWSRLEETAFPQSRLSFAHGQKLPMIYEIKW